MSLICGCDLSFVLTVSVTPLVTISIERRS
jgi:hypothetical protein